MRISPLFMDLNPSRGGSVTYSQDDEKLVVSFVDVPRYGCNSCTYTFQTVLYWDGRITMAYNKFTNFHRTTIVGISKGVYPINWQATEIIASVNYDIKCDAPMDGLEVLVPPERRSPTQEFYRWAPRHSTMSNEENVEDDMAETAEQIRDLENELNDSIGSMSSGDKSQDEMESASSDDAGAMSTGNDFDLEDHSVMWEPLSVPGYAPACTTPLNDGFPVKEAEWNSLSLRDDDSQQVNLQSPFPFFGTEYNSVYIGSNGYATFGVSDRMYYSHRYYHFRYPRVSCLFMDLNPSRGGSVHYAHMEDRFVVKFEDIQRYGMSAETANFEMELFYDGHVRCSYGAVLPRSNRIITGISGGAATNVRYYNHVLRDLSVLKDTCPADEEGGNGAGALSAGKYANELGPLTLSAKGNAQPEVCPVMAMLPSDFEFLPYDYDVAEEVKETAVEDAPTAATASEDSSAASIGMTVSAMVAVIVALVL
jgi:hypothetical protein